jgi:hypothetical protein
MGVVGETERETCPACGGAGGGPMGPAGSAWDDESYVCPRCEGEGVLTAPSQRPGLVKASTTLTTADDDERQATG